MKPAALSFGLGKALVLIGALAGLIACSSTEGETPTCVQDVKPGVHDINPNGCNQFAKCLQVVGNELKEVDAEQCCKIFTNDTEHAACLYGYGAGPAPGGT